MTQNEHNYVVHIEEKEDAPFLPKLLFAIGILYVLGVCYIIAMSN